jgi:uncharacterized peroxidase-related enzyme
MFLRTIVEDDAIGGVAEIYEKQKSQLGFIMAATQCFTARPDLLPIYTDFSNKIRSGFSLGVREWRLITLVAAKHVPSTYCAYVYSQQLIGDLGSKQAVLAVHRDFRTAGLPDKDVAMLAYAEKIVLNASGIAESDIDGLRSAGFTDQQICDIALCAAFRCFVSRFFDAVGAGPEAAFIDDDTEFRTAMTVGRSY